MPVDLDGDGIADATADVTMQMITTVAELKDIDGDGIADGVLALAVKDPAKGAAAAAAVNATTAAATAAGTATIAASASRASRPQ